MARKGTNKGGLSGVIYIVILVFIPLIIVYNNYGTVLSKNHAILSANLSDTSVLLKSSIMKDGYGAAGGDTIISSSEIPIITHDILNRSYNGLHDTDNLNSNSMFVNLNNNTVSEKDSYYYGRLTPQSKYAYITLMHGVDSTLKYRGFLYNAIIMKYQLVNKYKSNADFIVMIGFTNLIYNNKIEFEYVINDLDTNIKEDIELLQDFHIQVIFLPNFIEKQRNEKIGFAEMALLKITPYSLIEYNRIQFLDGDIFPTDSMDCYFATTSSNKEHNNVYSYNTGSASPVNSGWYLLTPNIDMYKHMKTLAIKRLSQKWDVGLGWGIPLAGANNQLVGIDSLYYRSWNHKRVVKSWEFNGASLDQGLTAYYFLMFHKQLENDLVDVNVINDEYIPYDFALVDTNLIELNSVFINNHKVKLQKTKMKSSKYFTKCDYNLASSQSLFVHFTGRKKPWVQLQSMYKKYLNENKNSTDISFDLLRKYNIRSRGVSKQDIQMISNWLVILDEIDAYTKEHSKKNISIQSNSMKSFLKIGSPLGYFAANT